MPKQLAHVVEAKWRSDDINIHDGRDFSSLNLDKRIIDGLLKAGYRIPSPIQLEAIPKCLTGDDVFVQGKAGTGKTLVFSILALTAVLEAEDLEVLIVAPTREGAFQIYNTICAIGSEVEDLKCEYFIGGFSYDEDIPKACECKIAVGTPGRLLHLIENYQLKLDTVRLFIIDDFDELNDKTLKPDVSEIFDNLPERKQTVVASLTCADEVMELAHEFLKQPFQACLNENELSLLGMTHYYHIVPMANFLPLLSYRKKLEALKKILFNVKFSQCIIFCNSVQRVEPLCIDIRMWGLSAVFITKVKDQVERLHAIELLKKNKCKILVSTDVCSRGLDAENVDLVINFDMPHNCRVYLHRCGRAGRYGAKCSSITFLIKYQKDQFDEMENQGHFNSNALPEPIPEDLNCGINPSAATSIPHNLETCSKVSCQISVGESSSLPIVNKNEETSLENVEEDYSVTIANEIEDQTVDLETSNNPDLVEDFEMAISSLFLNYNQQPEVFSEEGENKSYEGNSCKTVPTSCKNETIGEFALEGASSSSNLKILRKSEIPESDDKHHNDFVTTSSECKSLPLKVTFGNLAVNSDGKTLEIETGQHLKNTSTESEYSSFEEMDLGSSSQTVPKSTFNMKYAPQISEKHVLCKAFDKMHLEKEKKCRRKPTKIPQVSRNNKKLYEKVRSNKKSAKSFDCCKSQSKFSGLNTTSPEFDANHTCTKCYCGYPANLMDKKKVNKNHKMHSTHGKYLDKCNHLSQTCNWNIQRNPKSCHASTQHCCHFPNNYHLLTFPQQWDDMFYKQWMFINNFSYFLSMLNGKK